MLVLQIILFTYRCFFPIDAYNPNINIAEFILLGIMWTKVMFFLKIYLEYGMIVELMISILDKIQPFFLIFVMFITSFALSYYVLDAEFHDIDQKQIYYAVACFFNSYELSTGQAHNAYLIEPYALQTSVVWFLWLA